MWKETETTPGKHGPLHHLRLLEIQIAHVVVIIRVYQYKK
jgi:hypothetical protein